MFAGQNNMSFNDDEKDEDSDDKDKESDDSANDQDSQQIS